MSFIDENPYNLTYYRLKIKDIDGKIVLSKIITLKRSDTEGGADFSIFPNPTSNDFTVQFHTDATTFLECRDIVGRLIFTRKINTLTEAFHFSAKSMNLKAGTYFLKTNRVGGRVQRLVVLR
jgi:hypothetical protein